MFFSSRVDLILIWIDNVLIMARIYILFNPFKKNDSFKFRIILASEPDANSTCAKGANDTKFCLTFSLITPLFSSLSMNLRGILTRTEVLRFLNSQVLFQLVKNREYHPPSKPSQPYVTIKTNREKPCLRTD